jgi:hypothetical protein
MGGFYGAPSGASRAMIDQASPMPVRPKGGTGGLDLVSGDADASSNGSLSGSPPMTM